MQNLIQALKRSGKHIFARLREKPQVDIDEYNLQHMLFYHGLIGSSPENEKAFREVKTDILEATRQRSSVQLAIALKLSPLWWEEKLISIVRALTPEDQAQLMALLFPRDLPHDQLRQLTDNSSPIMHDDWRVRANSALIAAQLQADVAVPILSAMLEDDSASGKLASAQATYALGKLRSEKARAVLIKHAGAAESWLRVDIAGALALSEFELVAKPLAEMLAQESESLDYLSVAIARRHEPRSFNASSDKSIKDASAILVIGIVEASQGSFTNDIVLETKASNLLPSFTAQVLNNPDLLQLRAAFSLLQWTEIVHGANRGATNNNGLTGLLVPTPHDFPSLPEIDALKSGLNSEEVKSFVLKSLEELVIHNAQNTIEPVAITRATFDLCGLLGIKAAVPLLLPLLRDNFAYSNMVINVLGRLGDPVSASALIDFAQQAVDINKRNALPKSKQPVFEDDIMAATRYFLTMRALGSIATERSAEFLIKATGDFAPDKRSQAFNALTQVLETDPSLAPANLDHILAAGLQDPAAMVQREAVAAVAKLKRLNLIKETVSLIDANENLLSQAAFSTLKELADSEGKPAVQAALAEKLKSTKDSYKRKRIEALLVQ
jgi:hypothetical protein